MKLIQQLNENREKIQARGQQIIDKATAENRHTLTDVEERDFKKVTEELRGIDESLAKFRASEEEDRSIAEAFGKLNDQPIAEGYTGPEGRTWLPGLAEFRQLKSEQRAVGTTGAFIPTGTSKQYFDLLRKRTAVLAAGPVLIPMSGVGSIKVPKVTSSVNVQALAEAAAIAETDPGLDEITLDTKKFGAYTLVNREALEDSNPQLREVVSNSLIRDTAVELDKQLVTGSGSGQNLRGLRNVSGVTAGAATGTNGGALTFAFLADTLGAAEGANVDPDKLAWIMHSRTWASVRKLADTASRPIVSIDPTVGVRPTLWGHPVFISNSLSVVETKGSSSDCSSIILADMSQVVVGVARNVELAYSEDFKFDTDQVAVRVTARYDIGVPQPTAITITEGVRP